MSDLKFNERVLALIRDMHARTGRVLTDDLYSRLPSNRGPDVAMALEALRMGGRIRIEPTGPGGAAVITPIDDLS